MLHGSHASVVARTSEDTSLRDHRGVGGVEIIQLDITSPVAMDAIAGSTGAGRRAPIDSTGIIFLKVVKMAATDARLGARGARGNPSPRESRVTFGRTLGPELRIGAREADRCNAQRQ